jgi:DNA repair/transcription protein MET18/MMS19
MQHILINCISDSILDLLSSVSSISPRHVSQTTLPLLFSSLPDQAPSRAAEPERVKVWTTLSFLKRLCIQADLFERLVIRLSTKLDLICVPSGDSIADLEDQEPTAAYAHSLLRTLADALSQKVQLNHPDVAKYVDRLLPRLFYLHIYSTLVSDGDYLVPTDSRLVFVSAEIVNLVLQTATAQYAPCRLSIWLKDLFLNRKQEQFSKSLFEAFLESKPESIAQGYHKLPEYRVFSPFKVADLPTASLAFRIR